MESQKLSSLQLELLNMYSFQPNDEDLLAIKNLIALYFAKKIQVKIRDAIKEKNITENDLDRWLNE